MKQIYILFIALLTSCSFASPPAPIGIQEVTTAMAIGTIKELSKFSPDIEKELLVRLFEYPAEVSQDCFIETSGTCYYSYLISVSTFDEYPEVQLYKLKAQGEITSINWRKVDKPDYAEIEFSISRYSALALKNNTKLKNSEVIILTKITPKSIEEVTK